LLKHDQNLDLPIEVKVLDQGFVRLVNYMGSDATIVQSARVSYGPGTKTLREDRKLLEYLYKHGHTSPFEQVVVTFHMKLPIFIARQLVRHRTARINEMSGRYSVLPSAFFSAEYNAMKKGCNTLLPSNSKTNKQSGNYEDLIEVPLDLYHEWEENAKKAFEIYERLIALGVSREIARIHLPQSTYTEWYFQMDLNNLIKLIQKRLDSGAQKQTREYAQAMLCLARKVAPETMEIAFPRD
jgi:thymidylate synthase (FAD)